MKTYMSEMIKTVTRIFGCQTDTPLFFTVCGQLVSPSGFRHHRRCFDENVIIIITEGTLSITANRVEFNLSAGQYIFLKAGEEHFGHRTSDEKLLYFWVHFRSDHCFETINGNESVYTYIVPETGLLSEFSRAVPLYHQLVELSLEEKGYFRHMTDYAVSLLLLELTKEYCRSQDGRDRYPAAVVLTREWIKKHYNQSFDVPKLAEAVGYRADYLSTLFKNSMGISIVRYTNQLRITMAKNLLSNYNVSIKEAAFSCGFSDEKYFMKVFKQLERITPSQYKNSYGRSESV